MYEGKRYITILYLVGDSKNIILKNTYEVVKGQRVLWFFEGYKSIELDS